MSKEFLWPVRVYYEDTDAGGVVYHSNYLSYMERARTEWLRKLGYSQASMAAELGVVFAVRHAELDFKSPARLDDELVVDTIIINYRKTSLVFKQTIMKGEYVLCAGQVTIVCINADSFRPCAIPEILLRELEHVC